MNKTTLTSFVTFIFVALFGVFSPTCSAKIGEMQKQIAARYGAGKEIGDQVLYSDKDLNINVFYDEIGKSRMEIYSKRVDNDGVQAELSPAEIKNILATNGESLMWFIHEDTAVNPSWYRQDGKVYAQYHTADKAMVFVVTGQPAPSVKHNLKN